MKESDLRKLAAVWQDQLRLRDWDLDVRYADIMTMSEDGELAWGRSWIFPTFREATILILQPGDYIHGEGQDEIEDTLVHEMLHVYSTPMRGDNTDPQLSTLEEQMLNALATLLVRLRKGQL